MAHPVGTDDRKVRRNTAGRWGLTAVATLCGILLATVAPTPGYADDPTPRDAWHVATLDLDAAHKVGRGAGVTVALLDGSVETHRDLRGALLPALDATDGADDPQPGSGTAAAGLIAARGDGVAGLRGVAPEAKLLPIRVGANAIQSEPAALARGLDLAVSRGARVVAVSYVGTAEITDDLRRAVRAAVAADVLVVAVASPLFGSISTLGALPGVVSVGATDRDGRRQGLGADGNLDIDLLAPGEEVLSLLRLSGPGGDLYRPVAGPQYAVAIVAGVAALVRGRFPDLSAADTIHRLRTTSPDGPAPRNLVRGWGLVSPVAALTVDPVALPAPAGAGGSAPTAGWLPRDSQWYLDALRIPEAHRVTRGSGIAIGMLTDSLYLEHPDLRGQVDSSAWQQHSGEVRTGPLPDRLANPPSDVDLTGQTGVAGAAVARGGDGLLGIAPEARLVTVRSENLSSRQVGPGLRWLTDHGAKVIIVPSVELDEEGQDAIRYAASRDVVLVGTASDAPAGVPGVLAVAELNADGKVQTHGSGLLAAPGGRHVLVTKAPGAKAPQPYGFGLLDGVGSGIVAGVAALVRARFPELNAASVVDRLVGTASPLTDGATEIGEQRLVDPLAALTADRPPARANPAGDPGPPRRTGSGDGLGLGLGSTVLLAGAALLLLAIVGVLVVLLVVARRRAANRVRSAGSGPLPAGYPAPPGPHWPAGPPPAGPPSAGPPPAGPPAPPPAGPPPAGPHRSGGPSGYGG